MKKISLFALALIAVTLSVITGCQKQESINLVDKEVNNSTVYEPQPANIPSKDPVIAKLQADPQVQAELKFLHEKMGVNLSEVYITKEEPGGYAFQGAGMSRKSVQEYMKASEPQANAKSRVRSIMANAGTWSVRSLTAVPSGWKTAVSGATSNWNSLAQTLKFSVVSTASSAHIDVRYVSFSALGWPADYAKGEFPNSNGTIGYRVSINSDLGALTANQMKWVMTHELGHCIGFCHSDTQDGIAAYTLSSAACNSGFDAASVMICGCNVTSVPSWGTSGFSYCDKEVFNLKYGLLS